MRREGELLRLPVGTMPGASCRADSAECVQSVQELSEASTWGSSGDHGDSRRYRSHHRRARLKSRDSAGGKADQATRIQCFRATTQ